MAYNITDYTDPHYTEYKTRLLALLPINTSDKARAYRELWREFYGWTEEAVEQE